jgi:hypothetical protein
LIGLVWDSANSQIPSMAHAAILVFNGVNDKAYNQASVAIMEDDVLALCKHFYVSQETVTNMHGDDFTTIGKIRLVSDPEDSEEFLGCAVKNMVQHGRPAALSEAASRKRSSQGHRRCCCSSLKEGEGLRFIG